MADNFFGLPGLPELVHEPVRFNDYSEVTQIPSQFSLADIFNFHNLAGSHSFSAPEATPWAGNIKSTFHPQPSPQYPTLEQIFGLLNQGG